MKEGYGEKLGRWSWHWTHDFRRARVVGAYNKRPEKTAIPSVWGNQEIISISGNLIAYDGEVVQGCSIHRVGHGN